MNKKFILSIALAGVFTQSYAQQQEKQIEEITIASKSSQKINKTGRNTTLLTEKDLEKYKGQSLSNVLEQVSGFQITNNFSNNNEPKTFLVRGGNNANVVILVDGVPLQDVTTPQGNTTDIRLLSLDNIASIEILNGASSVLYGANATTAVIDIKTKKNTSKLIDTTLGVRTGSYNTFAQNINLNGKQSVFSYLISGSSEKSEGISSAKGDDTFDKDGYEKQNINVKLGIDLNNFNFNVLGGWNHHLYDYDADAFKDGKSRGNDTQYYIGFNSNYAYNIGKLTLNTRYTELERIYENFISTKYDKQDSYKGINYFAELYNELKFGQYLNFVIGGQYGQHRLGLDNVWGSHLNSKDTKIQHLDAFSNARFNYKFFNLDLGTRMTSHSKFGTHWVYNINPYLYQEFGSWYGKAGYSIGTAFIAPTLYQTYGDGNSTKPNFDLNPETNQSQEINLSFGKQDRSLVVNASLFHRKDKNAIIYGNQAYTNSNIENSTRGFEAGFDYSIFSFIKIGGNFTFIEKGTENEKTMVRQPKQRANSYVEINAFKGNKINLTHTFVGKRHDVYWDSSWVEHKVILNDFNLFNVGVSQKINDNMNTYFQLNNIFNKKYIDVVGYTTKNRNFVFGIDYKF